MQIQRWRTAKTRRGLSTPFKALAAHGYLEGAYTLMDYGCGRGDDLRATVAQGVDAVGWDPHWHPGGPKRPSDVVVCAFVINVIEDPGERARVLADAFALAGEVMCVAAMRPGGSKGAAFSDGIVTKANTFQRTFSDRELAEYVREVLGVEPVKVGPSCVLVFASEAARQRFLAISEGPE